MGALSTTFTYQFLSIYMTKLCTKCNRDTHLPTFLLDWKEVCLFCYIEIFPTFKIKHVSRRFINA